MILFYYLKGTGFLESGVLCLLFVGMTLGFLHHDAVVKGGDDAAVDVVFHGLQFYFDWEVEEAEQVLKFVDTINTDKSVVGKMPAVIICIEP